MEIEQETKPIFATQGGGYAVYEGGRYVWHSEIPSFVNAQVGDPIPEEWGVVAVNEAAIDEVEESFNTCQGCGQPGCQGDCDPSWVHDSTYDQ
jgi:hypothetical protein